MFSGQRAWCQQTYAVSKPVQANQQEELAWRFFYFPLQVSDQTTWFWNLLPFDSNFLAVDFRLIFDFLTHALIGSYYITNSREGIMYADVALSP